MNALLITHAKELVEIQLEAICVNVTWDLNFTPLKDAEVKIYHT